MTTKEIADQLVSYCREGKFDEAYKNLFAENAKCIEPMAEWSVEGLDNLLAKGANWAKTTQVHAMSIADPIVAGSHFTTNFILDSTNTQTNERTTMEEIAVYTVENGKIVSEQFFYDLPPQQ